LERGGIRREEKTERIGEEREAKREREAGERQRRGSVSTRGRN
jgi:hypothetical protein